MCYRIFLSFLVVLTLSNCLQKKNDSFLPSGTSITSLINSNCKKANSKKIQVLYSLGDKKTELFLVKNYNCNGNANLSLAANQPKTIYIFNYGPTNDPIFKGQQQNVDDLRATNTRVVNMYNVPPSQVEQILKKNPADLVWVTGHGDEEGKIWGYQTSTKTEIPYNRDDILGAISKSQPEATTILNSCFSDAVKESVNMTGGAPGAFNYDKLPSLVKVLRENPDPTIGDLYKQVKADQISTMDLVRRDFLNPTSEKEKLLDADRLVKSAKPEYREELSNVVDDYLWNTADPKSVTESINKLKQEKDQMEQAGINEENQAAYAKVKEDILGWEARLEAEGWNIDPEKNKQEQTDQFLQKLNRACGGNGEFADWTKCYDVEPPPGTDPNASLFKANQEKPVLTTEDLQPQPQPQPQPEPQPQQQAQPQPEPQPQPPTPQEINNPNNNQGDDDEDDVV